jgi:potassium/hydrogen antiporter
MDFLNQLILLGGALFLISILASTLSPRVGMPLLLVFLIIGMLAGEDGVGGIQFDDVESAYFLATLALAVILVTIRHGRRQRVCSGASGIKSSMRGV